MPYIGKSPTQAVRQKYQYTATASQTTFSGSDTNSLTLAYTDENYIDVTQNGVMLKGGGNDYTATTGTSVVLATGATADDVIEIIVYDVFAVADHVKKSGDIMTGQLQIQSTDTAIGLRIESADAGAADAPIIDLYRNSASPADNDDIGQIRFNGQNDAGEKIMYASMFAEIDDASDGTENGAIVFNLEDDGGLNRMVQIGTDETVFNTNGLDIDFRVESNNNINMLYVDGGSDVVTVGGLVGTAGNEDAGYGPLQVGNTAQTDCIIQMLSANDTSCTIHFGDAVSGNGRFEGFIQYNHPNNSMSFGTNQSSRATISNTGVLTVPQTASNTTSASANMVVTSGGEFAKSTSSRRYKNTINDATHGLADLLKLRSVTFKGNTDGDTVFGGLIAEEVHDAGLTEFVEYDDQNRPDALHYTHMVALCVKAIQELKTELDNAKARIATLEGK